MIDTKTVLLLSKYEDEIIDLLDRRDEMDNGDFQAVVSAIVLRVYNEGKANA